MEDTKLSIKQETFVRSYLKSFNGAQAVTEAGYAFPRTEAVRLLAHPSIKARINQFLEQIRAEGIGNKAVRLAELNDLQDKLKAITQARAEDAIERLKAGEVLPPGIETGLLIETIAYKGASAKEWAVDTKLVNDRIKIMEQAARETGDRDKRIELTGKDGGPLEIASAKDKLTDLLTNGPGS